MNTPEHFARALAKALEERDRLEVKRAELLARYEQLREAAEEVLYCQHTGSFGRDGKMGFELLKVALEERKT